MKSVQATQWSGSPLALFWFRTLTGGVVQHRGDDVILRPEERRIFLDRFEMVFLSTEGMMS